MLFALLALFALLCATPIEEPTTFLTYPCLCPCRYGGYLGIKYLLAGRLDLAPLVVAGGMLLCLLLVCCLECRPLLSPLQQASHGLPQLTPPIASGRRHPCEHTRACTLP